MTARKTVTTLAAALIGGVLSTAEIPWQSKPAMAQTSTDEELPVEEVVFVPPGGGAPRDRIGAGTRGAGGGALLRLIAPAKGGVTATSSPKLYWWLKEAYSGEVEITIRRDGSTQPLLSMTETMSLDGGLNSIDLSDMGMRLRADQVYHWSVALKSKQVKALNLVEFRSPDAAIEGSAAAKVKSLAGQGYWYDAYALTAEAPGMEKIRDALQSQAGIALPE